VVINSIFNQSLDSDFSKKSGSLAVTGCGIAGWHAKAGLEWLSGKIQRKISTPGFT